MSSFGRESTPMPSSSSPFGLAKTNHIIVARFTDSACEAAYQRHRVKLFTKHGPTYSRTMGLVCFILIVVACCEGAFRAETFWPYWFLNVGAEIYIMLFHLVYSFLLKKMPQYSAPWYNVLQLAHHWLPAFVGSLTPDRAAALFGMEQPVRCSYGLQEVISCIAVVAIIAAHAFVVHTCPSFVFAMVQVATLTYLVTTTSLGSTEYTCLSVVDGAKGSYGLKSCQLSLYIWIAGMLMYYGRREQETHERASFFETYSLTETLNEKERSEQELQSRLDELDQLSNALHTAAKHPEQELQSRLNQLDQLTISLHTVVGQLSRNSSGFQVPPTPAGPTLMNQPQGEQRVYTVPLPKLDEVAGLQDCSDMQMPNAQLVKLLAGRAADFSRIRHMAEHIRNPEYGLREFFADSVASFPELTLFLDRPESLAEGGGFTSSGRSGEAEYQRTIGALFAVYWLLRLDLDGRTSFCYGVDVDWRSAPIEELVEIDDASLKNGKSFFQMSGDEKRASFLRTMDWSMLSGLVKQCGCAAEAPECTERIMALLCLTAFHDVMKVEALLPRVQAEHAPYLGYEAGVQINDHDIALSYILEHFPELMPSFVGLPADQQRSIVFTQGKLHFNHGWFVQAEAPPGAMLSNFKKALKTGTSPADVAFYFVHWLTDLAGAEATPLGGAEKFVLKFPHAVLSSFLWSIPFLQQLVNMSETAVVEAYLKERLKVLAPGHPLNQDGNQDSSAIACMRLAVMAQSDHKVIDAFHQLPQAHRQILEIELSRTGCVGQTYAASSVQGGPAFLIYYGPALIQRNINSPQDLLDALRALCHVLHAARVLWPAHRELQGRTVTIQVGELKSKDINVVTGAPEETSRMVWILLCQNDLEGSVELRRVAQLNDLIEKGERFYVIDFGIPLPAPSSEDGACAEEAEAAVAI